MNVNEQIYMNYELIAHYLSAGTMFLAMVVLLMQLVIKDKYRATFTITGVVSTIALIIVKFFVQKAQVEQVPELVIKNFTNNLRGELITWEIHDQLVSTLGNIVWVLLLTIVIAIIGFSLTKYDKTEKLWTKIGIVGTVLVVLTLFAMPITKNLQMQHAPHVYMTQKSDK